MAINYLAILVSSITVTIVGALWYGPLFGKVWIKLMGWSTEKVESAKKKNMTKPLITNFIATLVMITILALALDFTKTILLKDALLLTFFIWLGFVATVSLNGVLWEGKPFSLYVLNNAHILVSLIITTLILNSWP
jgi:hypothetical protein